MYSWLKTSKKNVASGFATIQWCRVPEMNWPCSDLEIVRLRHWDPLLGSQMRRGLAAAQFSPCSAWIAERNCSRRWSACSARRRVEELLYRMKCGDRNAVCAVREVAQSRQQRAAAHRTDKKIELFRKENFPSIDLWEQAL